MKLSAVTRSSSTTTTCSRASRRWSGSTLRQFAIGQVVINERIDEFYPFPGSKVPRMRFHVTGYFLIKDGKIEVWRDFTYPGAKQLIEPAPKA